MWDGSTFLQLPFLSEPLPTLWYRVGRSSGSLTTSRCRALLTQKTALWSYTGRVAYALPAMESIAPQDTHTSLPHRIKENMPAPAASCLFKFFCSNRQRERTAASQLFLQECPLSVNNSLGSQICSCSLSLIFLLLHSLLLLFLLILLLHPFLKFPHTHWSGAMVGERGCMCLGTADLVWALEGLSHSRFP